MRRDPHRRRVQEIARCAVSAPKIYVAAPWERGGEVRAMHSLLTSRGFEPTSNWVYCTDGKPEGRITPEIARPALARNYGDIKDSDAMLVLAYPGLGGEMFVEFGFARSQAIPVFWVGPRVILSTFAVGVTLCDDIPDALQALEVMKGANPWNTETI